MLTGIGKKPFPASYGAFFGLICGLFLGVAGLLLWHHVQAADDYWLITTAPSPSDHGPIRASGALGLIILQRLSWGVTCGCFIWPQTSQSLMEFFLFIAPSKRLLLVLAGFGSLQHVLRMYSHECCLHCLALMQQSKHPYLTRGICRYTSDWMQRGKWRSRALYCAIQSCLWLLTLWTQ